MLKTIRIMLKMIQNYQIYQNYVDSRKNDPDHDPLFILVFLKKNRIVIHMIVLPKNSNIVLLDRLLTEQDLRHTLWVGGQPFDF